MCPDISTRSDRRRPSHAINEARVKVAQADRNGQIGASEAQRDQRIQVANATQMRRVVKTWPSSKSRIPMPAAAATRPKPSAWRVRRSESRRPRHCKKHIPSNSRPKRRAPSATKPRNTRMSSCPPR